MYLYKTITKENARKTKTHSAFTHEDAFAPIGKMRRRTSPVDSEGTYRPKLLRPEYHNFTWSRDRSKNRSIQGVNFLQQLSLRAQSFYWVWYRLLCIVLRLKLLLWGLTLW